MNITLINPTFSFANYGLRILASYMKSKGHRVRILFLYQNNVDINYTYSEVLQSKILEFVENEDIIGFSFVSNCFYQAKRLTKQIKLFYPDKPIIWGGIHSIALPEECANIADYVCFCEGEDVFAEFAQKLSQNLSVKNIDGLCYKYNGKIIKNPIKDLKTNLNKLSFQDYDFETSFYNKENSIVILDYSELKEKLIGPVSYYKRSDCFAYLTITSRGCTGACTYCCNNMYKKIYQSNHLFRVRSNKNIIKELVEIKTKLPFINFIDFYDDDFINARKNSISDFCSLYKKYINLPFRINVTPESVNKIVLHQLVDAGLSHIEMGLQTASERIQKEVYKRPFSKNYFLNVARIIHAFPSVSLYYDILLDNPYEESIDYYETFRLLNQLPTPFYINSFSLTFYPGSSLYKKAIEDNIIKNPISEIYNKTNCITHNDKIPFIKFLLILIRKKQYFEIEFKIIIDLLLIKPVFLLLISKQFEPFWRKILIVKQIIGDCYRNLLSWLQKK